MTHLAFWMLQPSAHLAKARFLRRSRFGSWSSELNEQARDIKRLLPYQERSYELDRDLQIEQGKSKLSKAQEAVSLVLTTVGGVGMGLAIKFFDKDVAASTAAFVLSAAIVAAGVYLKVSAK